MVPPWPSLIVFNLLEDGVCDRLQASFVSCNRSANQCVIRKVVLVREYLNRVRSFIPAPRFRADGCLRRVSDKVQMDKNKTDGSRVTHRLLSRDSVRHLFRVTNTPDTHDSQCRFKRMYTQIRPKLELGQRGREE